MTNAVRGRKRKLVRESNKITDLDRKAAENVRRLWGEFRKEHKITQQEFAVKLGWSQSNFSQYMTCKVPIGMVALNKLSNAFGCQPGDIREEFGYKQAAQTSQFEGATEKELISMLEKTTEALRVLTKELGDIKGHEYESRYDYIVSQAHKTINDIAV